MQVGGAVQHLDLAKPPGQQRAGLFNILRGNGGQHLELARGVAADRADNGGGLDALHIAGVRYDDALDVFHDVAAARRYDMLRETAKRLPGDRACVGYRDRLGAAQRRDKLAFQDGGVLAVKLFFIAHCCVFTPMVCN